MWLDSLGPMEADASPVSPLELDPLSPIAVEPEESQAGERADSALQPTRQSFRRGPAHAATEVTT